ncbi:ferredoxin [Nocardia sp. NBC_01388]|uniref:ferredoxin n=1 Tax=Nocardia sp. NBC_01388 TaxID=2903596 RepID=UPI00324C4CA9
MTHTGSGEPAQRLHIDWTRCDGRGLCHELLPEILDRDDWGYPLAVDTLLIGPRYGAAARDAVALCPRLALALIPLDNG